jgi:hypothetical protein
MLLVEDLKELWYNDGVQVWDEHKHEYFGLKAILFVTVSDSLAARNLPGQSKKVGCGCPHCFREIDSQYWKDLDIRHSIDVMHVEKNVSESLLRILLNTDGKTRDNGHA